MSLIFFSVFTNGCFHDFIILFKWLLVFTNVRFRYVFFCFIKIRYVSDFVLTISILQVTGSTIDKVFFVVLPSCVAYVVSQGLFAIVA